MTKRSMKSWQKPPHLDQVQLFLQQSNLPASHQLQLLCKVFPVFWKIMEPTSRADSLHELYRDFTSTIMYNVEHSSTIVSSIWKRMKNKNLKMWTERYINLVEPLAVEIFIWNFLQCNFFQLIIDTEFVTDFKLRDTCWKWNLKISIIDNYGAAW